MSKDKRYQTDDLSKLPDDLDSVSQPQTQTVVVPTPPQPKQQPAAMPKPMPQSDYVCLKDRMAALLAEVDQLREKIEVQEGVLNAIRALETSVTEGQAKINEVLVEAVQRLVAAEVRRAEAETAAAEVAEQAAHARAQREQEAGQNQPAEEPKDDAPWWKLHWLGAWWSHRRQLKARKRRQREEQENTEWEIAQRQRLLKLRELADGPASVEGVQASIDADKLEEEINKKKKSAAA